MSDQHQTDFDKLQARKRQEAALRKQMQYINSLSLEDKEKIYAKKHKTAQPMKPTTLKGKIANYWYHYKWATIGGVFVIVLASFFLHDLLTKEKYDFEMLLATTEYYDTQVIEDSFNKTEKFAVDSDENGDPNLSVMYVQMDQENADTQDPNYYMAQFVKFTATLSEGKAAIYVLDQKNYDFLKQQDTSLEFEDLTQFSDNPNIDGDKFYLKGDPNLGELSKDNNLFFVLRKSEDIKKSKSEKVQKNYQDQVTYLTNLMNHTPEQ